MAEQGYVQIRRVVLLCQIGLICTFAENLFVNNGDFFEIVESYETLSLKLGLILDFYNSINPIFTLEYFKEISLMDSGQMEGL